MPDKIVDGSHVYRVLVPLDVQASWCTWLGEQRDARGVRRPVVLKHTGEENRTRSGADALWLEALLALKLSGPQSPVLLDYGVLDGRPFAVYEPIDGVSLERVLERLRERRSRLPAEVAVAIVLQACELVGKLHGLALEEGGAAGLVHAALCPQNLLLSTRGEVKVLGMVGCRPMGRVVARDQVAEPALRYAAPQLLEGEPLSPVVDVHALGAVLLAMLGDSADARAEQRSAELARVLRQQLQANPTGGCATVDALTELLQDAVRRTGTVVARQSIGAQVREACEQELIERRREMRAQLETPWGDEAVEPNRSDRVELGQSGGSTSVDAVEEFTEETLSDNNEQPQLAQYDEETSDDAVTRIYTGPELKPEPAEAVAPPAWVESEPVPAKAGWGRWTLVAALVVVAAGSTVTALVSSGEGGDTQVAAAAGTKAQPPEKMKRQEAAAPVAKVEPVADRVEDKASADESPAEAQAAADEVTAEAEANPAADDEAEEAAPTPVKRRARTARASARIGARAPRTRAARPAPRRAAAEAAPVARATVLDEGAADNDEAADETPAPAVARGEAPANEDLVIEDPDAIAFLSVDASPYATVFIDGEKRGVTPIVSLKLAPGPHRMVAKAEDGRVKRFSLLLESGQTERVKVTWEE